MKNIEPTIEITENGTLSISSEVIFKSKEMRDIIKLVKEYNKWCQGTNTKSKPPTQNS